MTSAIYLWHLETNKRNNRFAIILMTAFVLVVAAGISFSWPSLDHDHGCYFSAQVVEGLQMQALELLRSAARKAEEEEQSFSQQHVHTHGIVEAYMTLVNFCDRRLRESEQKEEGETAVDQYSTQLLS